METVTAAATDSTAVVAMPRRRGKSKAPNFCYSGPVSVIPLELDVSDERVRRRVERQWEAVFRLRRALQRDAADRCRAYFAAHHERKRDPKGLRDRLGLTRKGIAAAAKTHIEASRWMRDHLTKAVGLHVADEVWQTIDRHLFPDASGRRHGAPQVGSWWDFTRIPGRARSHTKTTPAWETWRLAGTVDGHLAAYRHPQLPASVTTAATAAEQRAGTSILAQPARLPAPDRPAGSTWWEHTGRLAVVFTGLVGGDVVLPVRLPQGAGQWAHLVHFLADPNMWHKIDMVRVRDRRVPGGWRYYAHLLVHHAGHQFAALRSPPDVVLGSTRTCRIFRWRHFPRTTRRSWLSSRSPCLPRSTRRLNGRRGGRGLGSARWIGLDATPTPTNTGCRRANRPAPCGERLPACRRNRS